MYASHKLLASTSQPPSCSGVPVWIVPHWVIRVYLLARFLSQDEWMLRVTQSNSAGRAKSYYSTADYYTQGQELTGFWRGIGASKLGLSGTVDRCDWDRLCDNLRPDTGEPLTVRRKDTRRVGYDFNFHVPKSVSLLYGLTRDTRILEAFQDSVRATMEDIEAESKSRVRVSGKNEDRVTGNLVWGEFTHFTARPVDGVPDPHLHAHCFVLNATFDEAEDRWKAGQFGDLKRDAPYFEAVFHSRLARRLEELGINTQRTAKGWELAGLAPETMDKFSRRTARIEKLAAAKGITDPDLKSTLGARTRSSKATELTMPDLESVWRARLTDSESERLDSIVNRIGKGTIAEDDSAARAAVARTMEHAFERASVLPERALLAEALKQGVGKASRESIERITEQQDLIHAERKGQRLVTTKSVLEEESKMLAFAREGRGVCKPIRASQNIFHREWLNDQQKAAVRHVLESRDRVVLIRGAAGTGKTTMMQEAREAIEASGQRVLAFAPSAGASRGVLREEGFETADTVARLLADPAMQRDAQGAVLWIDEAGLLGTKTMRQVFDLAGSLDARVVLSGDKRQHGAVERGAALRLLEDEAGLKPAEIKEIQRQKDKYKTAIKDLSEGKTKQGFNRLDELGWIREVRDEDRYKAIAESYIDAIHDGKSALVVSPTHFEGNRITDEIRRQLRVRGALGSDTHDLLELIPANLTLGQKHDPLSYRQGDVLVFHQNAPGHRKGTRLIVGQNDVPYESAERFTVFHQGNIEVATGDRIRITKNGTTADTAHRLNNGDLFTVTGFSGSGDLMLNNGWTVSKDYGHLAHGLVVTSYASQGKTVDRVIIGQSSRSFRASSREQFYVSASRGRQQVLVFTDDKDELLQAVSRSDERLSGTELISGLDDAHRRIIHERLTEQAREADIINVADRDRKGIEHVR